jgi:hypothetical protein
MSDQMRVFSKKETSVSKHDFKLKRCASLKKPEYTSH